MGRPQREVAGNKSASESLVDCGAHFASDNPIMSCTLHHQRGPCGRTARKRAIMIKSPILAIFAISAAITLLITCPTQASLIRIYHHRQRPGEDAAGQAALASGASSLADEAGAGSASALINETLAAEPGENRRAATIQFTSPMKRIMDLIGHHAPVIVVDSSAPETPPPPPTPAASQPLQFSQPQPQLQAQQQQQHWTIVDTSQLVQPAAQQPASVPNEQYFTFTPFGLAPASSPFGQPLGEGAFMGQQQQQLQPATSSQQQVTQSSQNYQLQQTGAPALALDGANQVQPVFLSSYVPELPLPGGQLMMAPNQFSSAGQFVPQAQMQPQQQQQQQQPQQQAPNSIQQQLRQAHKEQADDAQANHKSAPDQVDSKGEEGGGEDLDDRSAPRGRKQEGDEEGGEPPSSGGGGGEPDDNDGPSSSSGSSSYEDKYDSDRDEPQQRPTTNHASQQIAGGGGGLLNVGLNDDCLQCICRASSGCDHLLRCITIGAEERFCGPFQLTEEYWQRAGSPGDAANNFSSFEECANDADCAVETVTNYMKKYYRDCDGDENVTCADYARLHRLRPSECADTRKLHHHFEGYWQKFQRCAESYNRTRNGDDEDI